jgi:hypothetical protein
MHHRGQLMLVERMLGIVPHLTREISSPDGVDAGAGGKNPRITGESAAGRFASARPHPGPYPSGTPAEKGGQIAFPK